MVAISHGMANVIQANMRARSEAGTAASGQKATSRNPGVAGTEVLNRVLSRLAETVGVAEVERYFPRQAVLRISGKRVEVRARTGFVAQQLRARLLTPLKQAAQQELDPAAEVDFTTDTGAFAAAEVAVQAMPLPSAPPAPPSHLPRTRAGSSMPAPGRYRLEDFIIGDSNKLAFAAAERLADRECPRGFSPLFLHGPCGVGKTHLLQGIAARFRELHPGATIKCISGETFTNDFITSLRSGKIDQFRKAYRGVDLLCIDDVHFLQSKEATQEEMLHTFNAIDISGARVVLVSDEHPRNVRKVSEALVSRFLSGMVVKIELPEPALREKITRVMADRRSMRLEPAALSLVASRCGGPGTFGGSVRDIEGALTRVDAMRSLMPELSAGPEIGLTLVRKALGLSPEQAATARVRRPIRIEAICDGVCRTLGVQLEEILGRSKHARVVLARTLCAYLARQLTTMSFPEIARALGRSNHSTVVTAAKRFEKQLASEAELTLTDPGPDLNGTTLRGLFERLRDDIQRTATAA
jgi:chromosomal replication initiator protein